MAQYSYAGDGWTGDGYVPPADPNQYAIDNSTTDIAQIIRKHDQGLVLTADEQQRYDAHVAEGNARAAGAGGAANGSTVSPVQAAVSKIPDPLGKQFPDFAHPQIVPSPPTGQGFNASGQWTGPTPAGTGGGGVAATNPNDPLAGLVNYATQKQAENVGYIDNTLGPQLGAIRGAQAGLYAGQVQQDQTYANALNGWTAKAASDAAGANQMSGDLFNQYSGMLGGVVADNSRFVNDLSNTYAGMPQLTATHQVANLQAAQSSLTQSDYHTAQLYQAALERAQANPDDVQAQKDVLALSNQISRGANDVQNGGLTPEAKQAQLEALSRYGTLSASPQATAQEEFLYEQQRMKQEQDERASRGAVMRDLQSRGQLGSGMEIGNSLGSSQQISQNRLLGDLGTQATAVQRQMQALQGYGGLSTQMVGQGNQVDQFNKAQRLQALGVSAEQANQIAGNSQQLSEYNAGQSNQVGMFNAGQANQNAQFNANAYNTNSMFNAGQANNVNMFNTGQKNAVNMNNLNQNMAQGQFEDTYRATQQQNAATRANNLATAGLQAGAQNSTALTSWQGAGQGAINDTYGRNNKVTGVGIGAAGAIADAGRATTGLGMNTLGTWGPQDIAVAGLRGGANSGTAVMDGMKLQAGGAAADKAAEAIKSAPDDWLSSFLKPLGL